MPPTPTIERNRQALLTIVAAIVALLGGRDADGPITRGLRRAVLALLRPAESAVRRLIVVAAQGLASRGLAAPVARPFPASLVRSGDPQRTPAFRLFDRRKRFGRLIRVEPRGVPRIRSFGASPFAPPAASPPPPPPARRASADDRIESGALRLRLAALELALSDLPRQARRLNRHLARRRAAPHTLPPSPLRIGHPPGWRRRPDRDVDRVLREVHGLALEAIRAGPA
jgi:hypothetical protein